MTRKRYIKKRRYLLWRLLQLPCNQKNSKKDFIGASGKKTFQRLLK